MYILYYIHFILYIMISKLNYNYKYIDSKLFHYYIYNKSYYFINEEKKKNLSLLLLK